MGASRQDLRRGNSRSVGGAKHHAPEAWQREQEQRMFLIDEHGERPICNACRKLFAATPEEIRAFRREHPRIAIVCPAGIVRDCGRPETLRRREAAVAI
jgi:hypothetical protein